VVLTKNNVTKNTKLKKYNKDEALRGTHPLAPVTKAAVSGLAVFRIKVSKSCEGVPKSPTILLCNLMKIGALGNT
jgi:hypothetical protein